MATNPVTSGLRLQLDARTPGLSDGTALTTWADQSGNSNDASVATGCTGPVQKTSIIGSNPVVRFGGANTTGMMGSFNAWTGGAFTHLVLLANVLSSAAYARICSAYKSSNANDYNVTTGSTMGWDGVGNVCLIESANSVNKAVAAWPTLPTILGVGNSTTTRRYFSNGLPFDGFSKTMAYAPNKYLLGQSWTSSTISTTGSGKFDVGLFLYYDRLLSDLEVAQVTVWMQNEFGVSRAGLGGGGSYTFGG